MAKNDTYEILPQDILETLRYDVEALKKKLEEPQNKTNELILEIESLKDSIHDLNDIFKKALHQTEDEDIYKTIKVLNERIDAVVSQNETIAKGMLAISDKVEEFIQRQKQAPQARPTQMNQHSAMSNSGQSQNMPRSLPPQMKGIATSMPPPGPSGMKAPMPPSAPSRKRSFF